MNANDVMDMVNGEVVSEDEIAITSEYAFIDWANAIYNFMDDHGSTQKDIAEAIQRSPGRVSQVLDDESATNLTLGTMSRIARACGMRVRISLEDAHPAQVRGWEPKPIGGASRLKITFGETNAA